MENGHHTTYEKRPDASLTPFCPLFSIVLERFAGRRQKEDNKKRRFSVEGMIAVKNHFFLEAASIWELGRQDERFIKRKELEQAHKELIRERHRRNLFV